MMLGMRSKTSYYKNGIIKCHKSIPKTNFIYAVEQISELRNKCNRFESISLQHTRSYSTSKILNVNNDKSTITTLPFQFSSLVDLVEKSCVKYKVWLLLNIIKFRNIMWLIVVRFLHTSILIQNAF